MQLRALGSGWLKRWRWDIALAGCISAAVGILLVSEIGHRELTRGYQYGIQSIWMGARLNELSARLADAETGQRSYLLTWKEEYLEPYKQAVPIIRKLLEDMRPRYAVDPDPEADHVFGALVAAIGAKLAEIELTLQLTERARADRALEVIDSGIGRRTMDEIRFLLEDLALREETTARGVSGSWRSSLTLSRLGIAVATALNVLLLIVLFAGMKRDWRRANERQSVLNRTVHERTRQLDLLASRLQEASEAEKAAMARELHDELGALLTASKMDLARISSELGTANPRVREKLAAVMRNIDQGLAAKRRIVEGLRPSTLSYFGLGTAARDLAEQIAERSGWRLHIDLPEPDPELPEEIEIALYRVLQESLTNAAKYARARHVRVVLAWDPHCCQLDVEDDGVGFCSAEVRTSSQGLFGMRHRVEARGGIFEVTSAPHQGTRIRAVIPLRSAVTSAPAAGRPREHAHFLDLVRA
jgi:signal transduction histidine kinase